METEKIQEKREKTLKFHKKLGERIQDIMDLGWKITRVTQDIKSQEVEIIAEMNFNRVLK